MNDAHPEDRRRGVGQRGEELVRRHVTGIGWQLVDHNVRWREGELDLIALDGNTIVFGEVKTLVARGDAGRPGFSPFESITGRKQAQIRQLAKRWLADELGRGAYRIERRFNFLRFDAFAVTLDGDGRLLELEHLEDAF